MERRAYDAVGVTSALAVPEASNVSGVNAGVV